MLVELSMVEQRYDAVREVLDGATVKDVAIRYGVDRRTVHRFCAQVLEHDWATSSTTPPSSSLSSG